MKSGKKRKIAVAIFKCIACVAAFICVLICALCLVSRFCMDGGEIAFEATIISVDENWVTAQVTKQAFTLFYKRLPKEIIFSTGNFEDYDLKAGDVISGIFKGGTVKGNHVTVITVTVIE